MRTWSVLSFTQKGVRYEIRETKDGLRCDCPIFVIKGKEIGSCKHLRKMVKWVNEGMPKMQGIKEVK